METKRGGTYVVLSRELDPTRPFPRWEIAFKHRWRWLAALVAWILNGDDPQRRAYLQWHPDGVSYIEKKEP